MSATRSDWAFERISRPYRKRHGMVLAGYCTSQEMHFRSFHGDEVSAASDDECNSYFEIGSITKTLTAILACELVLQGKFNLDEPVKSYLAGFDALPDWITPRRLATHTSGLPRIPNGLPIPDLSNSYRSIGEAELATWTVEQKHFAPPSQTMAYSNLGVGLLGLAAGKVAGSDYRTALSDLVLIPLQMMQTHTDIPEEQKHRLKQPHGLFGKKVHVWDFDALAGCGALKSTAMDMMIYAKAFIAALNGADFPVAQAIRQSATVQLAGPKEFMPDICLGWLRLKDKKSGLPIWHHDGGTGGSSSTMFVCPDRKFAIFALANTRTTLWTSIRQIRADPMGLLSRLIDENG